jgi:signal transduction histidine kinase/ActR/RegA family two-component response regulator
MPYPRPHGAPAATGFSAWLADLGDGDWRLALIRWQLSLGGLLFLVLCGTVVALDGDPASLPPMLTAAAVDVALLLALRVRPDWRPRIAVVDLTALVLTMLVLEAQLAEPQLSVWATLTVIPMFATLLAGRRATWPLFGVTSVSLLTMGALRGGPRVIDAIAAVGLAVFVAAISWFAETARVRAEDLAAARLEELTAQASEAQRANEAKSVFLATMSHEIRTPMNGVLGITRALLDTPLSDEQRVLARTALSSGQFLMTVLNDVLDLSRLEAGRLDMEEVAFSPGALVDEVYRLLGPLAEERGLTLRARTEAAPAWVRGDPNRLRQVLLNLVGNAVKFTEAGWIEVRLAYAEGILTFEVQDTGMGIAEDQQGALFDAFTQADSSTTRRWGGTGLGLAISRQLCERMGGTIGVQSALGAGSTFVFHVPAPVGEAPLAETTVTQDDALGLRVLLVEDNRVNQLVAQRTLEKLGCRVSTVDNGADAVERARDGDWDVVLMDCYMPTMDGFEATRQIRSLGGPRGAVAVLALTASATLQDRARVLESGMNDLLPKPLELATLRAALARWRPGRPVDAV